REARAEDVGIARVRRDRAHRAGPRRAPSAPERRAGIAAPGALRTGRALAGAGMPEDAAGRSGRAVARRADVAPGRAGPRDPGAGAPAALPGDARRRRDRPLRREGE